MTSFRRITAVVAGLGLMVSTGCATLAHHNAHSYKGKEVVTNCETKTHVCPWMIGNALLLIPGIVPGAIAFAVDFGTGAWNHDHTAVAWRGNNSDANWGYASRPYGLRQARLSHGYDGGYNGSLQYGAGYYDNGYNGSWRYGNRYSARNYNSWRYGNRYFDDADLYSSWYDNRWYGANLNAGWNYNNRRARLTSSNTWYGW